MSEHPTLADSDIKLCEAFSVSKIDVNRWVVQTPFIYDDGDALPVFLTLADHGWELTDQGMTVSHLFFDDFEPTEARLDRLKTAASSMGADMDTYHVITLRLGHDPSALDIGDFLQVLAQVRGAAIAGKAERKQSHWYTTTLRNTVVHRLRNPGYESNWTPPLGKGQYSVDLRIPAESGFDPVVAFFASTPERVSNAALTVHRLNAANIPFQPLLAYHPDRVGSQAVYRFQDEVEDAGSAITSTPDNVAGLFSALKERGVLVID